MTGDETGGSQPHVFGTEDGEYMVKVKNNPQGARILINELLGGLCMDWLGIDHPASAVVDVPEEVITSSPGARFQSGEALAHGDAFGSQFCQSDPQAAVDASLLNNPENVGATLAFDTWVTNGDGRQYRVRKAQEGPGRYDFLPVDQGHSFGPEWTAESLQAATATLITVPDPPTPLTERDVEASIDRLKEFTQEDADSIVGQVPADWWSDDEREAARDYLVGRAPGAAAALEARYPAQPKEGAVTP
jgi:hypothetical protein